MNTVRERNTAMQMMLQVTLGFVVVWTLIWIVEGSTSGRFATASSRRSRRRSPCRCWREGTSNRRCPGSAARWWKKNCEAVFFSFVTLLLVMAGGLLPRSGLHRDRPSGRRLPVAVPTPVMPPVIPNPPPAVVPLP